MVTDKLTPGNVNLSLNALIACSASSLVPYLTKQLPIIAQLWQKIPLTEEGKGQYNYVQGNHGGAIKSIMYMGTNIS